MARLFGPARHVFGTVTFARLPFVLTDKKRVAMPFGAATLVPLLTFGLSAQATCAASTSSASRST